MFLLACLLIIYILLLSRTNYVKPTFYLLDLFREKRNNTLNLYHSPSLITENETKIF